MTVPAYEGSLLSAYQNLWNAYKKADENKVHVSDLAILPYDRYNEAQVQKASEIIPEFLLAMEKYYEAFNPEGFKKFNETRDTLANILDEWDEEWDNTQLDSWVEPFKMIKFREQNPGHFSGSWIAPTAKKVDKKFTAVINFLKSTSHYEIDEKNAEQFTHPCQELMNQVKVLWEADIRLHA